MFSLDHVVHYTKNPEEAVAKMKEEGFHAIQGGEHPNWGTYNSLCYFDLSYIEFLGIRDLELAKGVTDNMLVQCVVEQAHVGEGLSQLALRADNMEAAAKRLKEKGLQTGESVPGKRTRKDGSVIEWQLLFPKKDGYDGPPLPFIIEWKNSDDARRSDLIQQQAIGRHPAGDVYLSSIGLAVGNLDKRIAEWQDWFDLEPEERFTDDQLNARCQTLKLEGGNLLFCEPLGDGPVLQTVEKHGEHPILIDLTGTETDKERSMMGAIYRFQP
ncbi:MAG TPA: VOC family protein [Bacillales bacterium]|nr:VOC family protein [Bacillales bacterium]